MIKIYKKLFNENDYHMTRDGNEYYWGNQGAGIIVICNNKILLCLRSNYVNEPGTWSYPGGAIDSNEDPKKSAIRELVEETGYKNPIKKVTLLNVFEDKPKSFKYYTYIGYVDEEFVPKLNWENSDYGWFSIDEMPSNLHFGFKSILGKLKKLF